MSFRRGISLLALTVLMAASCIAPPSLDKKTRQLMDELDGYLALREAYAAKKQNQLDVYRNLAQATTDPARRYELEMLAAEEYFAFNFDSTQSYLKSCQSLARQIEDEERLNQASIMLGHLYDKAGNYLEATQILYSQIDTNALSEELKAEYFWTLYDYSKDMAGNSGMVERMSIPPAASFRARLYQLLPPSSDRYRALLRDQYIDEGQLDLADSVSTLLVQSVKSEDRDFAIHAFFQSELANLRGDQAERLYWLVKSAECDLINAVRDYASLTMVAQLILPSDVDRSFRYLRIAQEDALFYNAKLRPWQISRFLMEVEDAYSTRQDGVNRTNKIAAVFLAVLTVILAILARIWVRRSRKLAKMSRELEKSNKSLAMANATLNDLNRQISNASRVKEKYIVNVLQGLSAQISVIRTEDNRFRNLLKQGKADQLLKELSISGRSEKARDEFYETFDNTFLALYPDFVAQFNALLQPEARVIPPEGKLTTEQRVFALILLGVDDSKKIASMLDYSVSTIYNYKVAIKNASLGERETFEERVKALGK
jgi:DNA-binding CsgD family transcriptional regulator